MSDLYETDTVTWAETQAALLRRLEAGEPVNETVDWPNIIEEIEAVGRSETAAVVSLLVNVMDHKLRLMLWPDDPARRHWEVEVRAWLDQIADDHRPSMHIEDRMVQVYRRARLSLERHMLDAPAPSVPVPDVCPWTLDDLLAEAEAAHRWTPGS